MSTPFKSQPVFPNDQASATGGGPFGLTMRDHIAIQALPGILSTMHDPENGGYFYNFEQWPDERFEEKARFAYRFADAMIKVRRETS